MAEEMKKQILERREMMKSVDLDMESDQNLGLPQPALVKEKTGSTVISLTKEFNHILKTTDILQLIESRTSKRKYTEESLSLEELSFLLWTTQGIKNVIGKERKATLRTVPSAGARHPFETYLLVNRVDGLKKGLYHYLPLTHELELVKEIEEQIATVTDAFEGQIFFANAPVGFVWTVVPYRTEWRYVIDAQKYALLDAGHVCQNLYLAGEAIGCGVCAIGAYNQKLADELLGISSEPTAENDNEFVVYAAAVGKVE